MNGFTVSATAESSEKAEIIEQDRPDVITLDLHMPGENGADFKNYLGKMNIPTILITSVTMEEGPLVMDALSNGAMTYIQKPELKQMSDTQEELLTALSQASNYNVEIINQETSRKTAKFVEKKRIYDRHRVVDGRCWCAGKDTHKLSRQYPPYSHCSTHSSKLFQGLCRTFGQSMPI